MENAKLANNTLTVESDGTIVKIDFPSNTVWISQDGFHAQMTRQQMEALNKLFEGALAMFAMFDRGVTGERMAHIVAMAEKDWKNEKST